MREKLNMLLAILTKKFDEQSKFDRLYEKYKYLMITVAKEIINDRYMAEDIVHEAFLKISKNMSKIGNVDSNATKNYVITVTKTTAIDFYRSAVSRNEVFPDELDVLKAKELEQSTELTEENRVIEIINSMNDNFKDIFILKFVNGYSNSEIAEMLDIKEPAVRQRLSRGKKILAKELKKMGYY